MVGNKTLKKKKKKLRMLKWNIWTGEELNLAWGVSDKENKQTHLQRLKPRTSRLQTTISLLVVNRRKDTVCNAILLHFVCSDYIISCL